MKFLLSALQAIMVLAISLFALMLLSLLFFTATTAITLSPELLFAGVFIGLCLISCCSSNPSASATRSPSSTTYSPLTTPTTHFYPTPTTHYYPNQEGHIVHAHPSGSVANNYHGYPSEATIAPSAPPNPVHSSPW